VIPQKKSQRDPMPEVVYEPVETVSGVSAVVVEDNIKLRFAIFVSLISCAMSISAVVFIVRSIP
jgi:hypothetical protein